VYLLPEEFAVTLTPELVTPITPGRWRSPPGQSQHSEEPEYRTGGGSGKPRLLAMVAYL